MKMQTIIRQLAIATSLLGAGLAAAPAQAANGTINKENLKGTWQIALGGFTGCGNGTAVYTFALDSNGNSSTGTAVGHGACGNSTLSGQTFSLLSLNTNGSGTVGISCGSGCGWTFSIQVAPDRSSFNLVDVSDPNNYLVGSAVRQQ